MNRAFNLTMDGAPGQVMTTADVRESSEFANTYQRRLDKLERARQQRRKGREAPYKRNSGVARGQGLRDRPHQEDEGGRSSPVIRPDQRPRAGPPSHNSAKRVHEDGGCLLGVMAQGRQSKFRAIDCTEGGCEQYGDLVQSIAQPPGSNFLAVGVITSLAFST